jgi:hypothetical protein
MRNRGWRHFFGDGDGDLTVVVETGVEGGVGGGGGRVRPDWPRSFSTLGLGPPGALCWAALWAMANDVLSPRHAAARTNVVDFSVMAFSPRVSVDLASDPLSPIITLTDGIRNLSVRH